MNVIDTLMVTSTDRTFQRLDRRAGSDSRSFADVGCYVGLSGMGQSDSVETKEFSSLSRLTQPVFRPTTYIHEYE